MYPGEYQYSYYPHSYLHHHSFANTDADADGCIDLTQSMQMAKQQFQIHQTTDVDGFVEVIKLQQPRVQAPKALTPKAQHAPSTPWWMKPSAAAVDSSFSPDHQNQHQQQQEHLTVMRADTMFASPNDMTSSPAAAWTTMMNSAPRPQGQAARAVGATPAHVRYHPDRIYMHFRVSHRMV